MRELWGRPLLAGLLIVLVAAAGVLFAWRAGALQALDLHAYDAYLRLRSAAAPRDDRFAIVGAAEPDLERYDWPLSDAVLADVITAVLEDGARAVLVDIYRGRPRPPGSERLEALLKRHANVYAVARFGDLPGASTAAPPALAKASGRVGIADVVEDHDGVVRRGVLFLDDGKTVFTGLGFRAALAYLANEGIRQRPGGSGEEIRLGSALLRPFESNDGPYVGADAAGYLLLLDFAGGRQPFVQLSLSEVLERKDRRGALRDRVVFIGVMADSVKDYFASPFREGRNAVKPMYGVAIHAHAASQIVRMAKGESPGMHVLPEIQEALWIVLWCAAGAALALLRRRLLFVAALSIGGAAAAVASSYAAFSAYLWLPVAGAVTGFLLSGAALTAYLRAHESAQRRVLMQIFSRYVSQPLAEDIWENRRELLRHGRLAPRRLEATVMFTDIQGFTAISETLSPDQLMDWLSEYLGRMAQIVHEHDGVVEKFMGDGLMAAFGLHGERASQHARLAVDCALAMRAALDGLNPAWRARGLSAVRIRVGIHSGPVAYGTVGQGSRVESTVLGDTTNIASRLESLKQDPDAPAIEASDPEHGDSVCRILVSAETLSRLGDRYRVWKVGPVQLKGKSQVLEVYGIRGVA